MKIFLDTIGLSSIISMASVFTIDGLMVIEIFGIGYVLSIMINVVSVLTSKAEVTESYILTVVVGAGLGSTATALLFTKLINY